MRMRALERWRLHPESGMGAPRLQDATTLVQAQYAQVTEARSRL